MTEMIKLLRALVDTKKYKRTKQLMRTEETEAAFHFCRAAVSNCQELYFLEDTATPILQTDASDYGIGGYMYMITNGQVRVKGKVANTEEIETSIDTDTAILAVAVAQVDISDSEYAIIFSQHNAT